MQEIDHHIVRHVALLSRLSLNETECALYAKQLASILTYIETLNALSTDDVEPTSHVLGNMVNVDRPDEPRPSLSPDEALSVAVEREGGFFKIPKVIEGK